MKLFWNYLKFFFRSEVFESFHNIPQVYLFEACSASIAARATDLIGIHKGASTLCRVAKCNTLQLCCAAKVVRHMPLMRLCPHEKRIFCRPFSCYQNCGTRSANLGWFFSQTGWYHFETPYSSYAVRLLLMGPTIADRIFRPHSIERHTTAKLTQCPHILVARRNFCHAALPHFAVRPCRTLPLCAAWHSVGYL